MKIVHSILNLFVRFNLLNWKRMRKNLKNVGVPTWWANYNYVLIEISITISSLKYIQKISGHWIIPVVFHELLFKKSYLFPYFRMTSTIKTTMMLKTEITMVFFINYHRLKTWTMEVRVQKVPWRDFRLTKDPSWKVNLESTRIRLKNDTFTSPIC